jgi:hypothetical protein
LKGSPARSTASMSHLIGKESPSTAKSKVHA